MGPDSAGQILSFATRSFISKDLPGDLDRSPEISEISSDSLAEVDQIFEMRSRALEESVERQSQADTENTRLDEEFSKVCAEKIRPAMQAFLER